MGSEQPIAGWCEPDLVGSKNEPLSNDGKLMLSTTWLSHEATYLQPDGGMLVMCGVPLAGNHDAGANGHNCLV